MVYERSGRISAILILLLSLVFTSGCGGSAKMDAASPGTASGGEAPMAAPMAAEAAPEREEVSARDEGAYRSGPPAPPRVTGGVAQAAPPLPKPEPAKKAMEKPDMASTPPGETGSGVATGTGDKPSVAAPMLIYKAQLYMAVFETRKAIDAVEKLAKDQGGYLVSREDNRITVRVPSGKFDGAVDQIAKLGDLLHRNVSVQDVTDEYFDLQIRLRNLEVMRDRLEDLLKKATKVEEALAVERELERVAGEIERLKGRLKLLRELVTFSTITVEFQPRPADHIDSQVRLPFPWLGRLGLGELLRL